MLSGQQIQKTSRGGLCNCIPNLGQLSQLEEGSVLISDYNEIKGRRPTVNGLILSPVSEQRAKHAKLSLKSTRTEKQNLANIVVNNRSRERQRTHYQTTMQTSLFVESEHGFAKGGGKGEEKEGSICDRGEEYNSMGYSNYFRRNYKHQQIPEIVCSEKDESHDAKQAAQLQIMRGKAKRIHRIEELKFIATESICDDDDDVESFAAASEVLESNLCLQTNDDCQKRRKGLNSLSISNHSELND